MAFTNGEGSFEFKDLPAGRYSLAASKARYVPSQFGARRTGEMTGRPIEIADGQTVAGLQLRLLPGAVLAGQVTDEFGEPLADAAVSAQRFRNMGGVRRLVTARTAQCDDGGHFRIHGLPPGEYYLSASIQDTAATEPDEVVTTGVMNYAPTFYPGTTSVEDAQRIGLEAGQEVSAAIQLVPAKMPRVSGLIVTSSGMPPRGGTVKAESRSEVGAFVMSTTAQIRPDGTFTLNGVAPGSYLLNVRTNLDVERLTRGRAVDSGEFAIVPLVVDSEDINGLHVTTSKGLTIPGQVVHEGGRVPTGSVRIWSSSEGDGVTPFGDPSARVRQDGSFELENLLGARRINVMPPKGWMLKSVSHRNSDVTDEVVDFREGEPPGRLRVVLTSNLTYVSGSVRGRDGSPSTDYEVLVFPEAPGKERHSSRQIRNAKPDQAGAYRIEALPPGNYYAIALSELDEDRRFDPEFLARARTYATRFTLGEGQRQTVPLKLDPMP